MSSYDGVKICELVGIFILTHLATIFKKSDCGLYRDNGLLILHNVNEQQTDHTCKSINKIFNGVGFSRQVSDLVDIATNLKVVDFLDTFYLNNDTNKSYNKPNDPQEFQPPNSNNELPRIIGDR